MIEKSLKLEVTTLAMCWHLKLKNGKELGFTTHDQNIELNNVEYIASGGFTPGVMTNTAAFERDFLKIEGMISHDLIKTEDILSGVYDYAEISLFLVDYNNLNTGQFQLRKGWLGEVKSNESYFTAEIHGLLHAFSRTIGEIYSPQCRAIFGDDKCKVNIQQYTISLEVSEVESRTTFISSEISNVSEIYYYGNVKFLTGSNAGLWMEIQNFYEQKIKLRLPMPYEIQKGDRFQVYAGCNKSFNMCCVQYNNGINFRGEPHVPVISNILQ